MREVAVLSLDALDAGVTSTAQFRARAFALDRYAQRRSQTRPIVVLPSQPQTGSFSGAKRDIAMRVLTTDVGLTIGAPVGGHFDSTQLPQPLAHFDTCSDSHVDNQDSCLSDGLTYLCSAPCHRNVTHRSVRSVLGASSFRDYDCEGQIVLRVG
jgi:hypothetical protein